MTAFGKRSHHRPSLGIEALEARNLFASDLAACDGVDASLATSPSVLFKRDVAESALIAETVSSGSLVASRFQSTDAGASFRSAVDVGSLDGTHDFRGSLGWDDWIDIVRFNVERDADVQLEISRLNRNANLHLADRDGNVIAQSLNRGRNVDAIDVTLDAGEYFVIVTATTFRSTRYRLTIDAVLVPVANRPIRDGTGEAGDETTRSTPTGDVVDERERTEERVGDPLSVIAPLADVPYFGTHRDWNVNSIGAPEAWSAGYTGEGVLVAVVDTGVDIDHPDLVHSLFVNAGEISGNGIDDDGNGFIDDVSGYDFVGGDANPDDTNGHGTHVAGTIAAANNRFGATGIAPDAKILPVRVLGTGGGGSDSGVAAGIRYAADMGADIINLSLGGGFSRAIDAAIDYARSLGSLIVAAAGNESAAQPSFPARFSATDSNVISVGAFSSSGTLAGFSNRVGGSGSIQVDAPGVGIYSTYIGGGYATLSGTSMAAPHVAGLAALMLSANPNLTSEALRNLLASGTVGRAGGSDAWGAVNATTSVAYAAAGYSNVPATASGNSQNTNFVADSHMARITSITEQYVELPFAGIEINDLTLAQSDNLHVSSDRDHELDRDTLAWNTASTTIKRMAADFVRLRANASDRDNWFAELGRDDRTAMEFELSESAELSFLLRTFGQVSVFR